MLRLMHFFYFLIYIARDPQVIQFHSEIPFTCQFSQVCLCRNGFDGRHGRDGLTIPGAPGQNGRHGRDGRDGKNGATGREGPMVRVNLLQAKKNHVPIYHPQSFYENSFIRI